MTKKLVGINKRRDESVSCSGKRPPRSPYNRINLFRCVEERSLKSFDARSLENFKVTVGLISVKSRRVIINENSRNPLDLGATLIIFAVINEDIDMIKYLLSEGADPTIVDKNGDDAKYYADRNQEILDILTPYYPQK